MAAIRNVVIEDLGASWRVFYEWSNDQQTAPWQDFEARFPRDFGEINPDETEQAMVMLAIAVAQGQGVHD